MVSFLLEDITYKKDDGDKNYKLLVLDADDKNISGINLEYLNNVEADEVVNIQKEYAAKMAPYVKKAYRKFKKENLLKEEKIDG